MADDDFESKAHLTKHLTSGKYNVHRERSRINSWEEQDWLLWTEFLGLTLTPERCTPDTLKTIGEAQKYRKAFKSYKFGLPTALGNKWVLIGILAVVFLVVFHFMGMI